MCRLVILQTRLQSARAPRSVREMPPVAGGCPKAARGVAPTYGEWGYDGAPSWPGLTMRDTRQSIAAYLACRLSCWAAVKCEGNAPSGGGLSQNCMGRGPDMWGVGLPEGSAVARSHPMEHPRKCASTFAWMVCSLSLGVATLRCAPLFFRDGERAELRSSDLSTAEPTLG